MATKKAVAKGGKISPPTPLVHEARFLLPPSRVPRPSAPFQCHWRARHQDGPDRTNLRRQRPSRCALLASIQLLSREETHRLSRSGHAHCTDAAEVIDRDVDRDRRSSAVSSRSRELAGLGNDNEWIRSQDVKIDDDQEDEGRHDARRSKPKPRPRNNSSCSVTWPRMCDVAALRKSRLSSACTGAVSTSRRHAAEVCGHPHRVDVIGSLSWLVRIFRCRAVVRGGDQFPDNLGTRDPGMLPPPLMGYFAAPGRVHAILRASPARNGNPPRHFF